MVIPKGVPLLDELQNCSNPAVTTIYFTSGPLKLSLQHSPPPLSPGLRLPSLKGGRGGWQSCDWLTAVLWESPARCIEFIQQQRGRNATTLEAMQGISVFARKKESVWSILLKTSVQNLSLIVCRFLPMWKCNPVRLRTNRILHAWNLRRISCK